MVDENGFRAALSGLRSHMLAGDLDDLAIETLGPEYAPLRRVSLAVRIVVTDWDDHEDLEPDLSVDALEVEYCKERRRQIVELWRFLRPSFAGGSPGSV